VIGQNDVNTTVNLAAFQSASFLTLLTFYFTVAKSTTAEVPVINAADFLNQMTYVKHICGKHYGDRIDLSHIS
jgi:hypothetical protein